MQHDGTFHSSGRYDAVLVGAGIMSATLAALLHELDPDLRLLMVERLEGPALESSAATNNAGTGHAANCELNYTPQAADGSIPIAKALQINQNFERSLEFWASLTERGKLDPALFLRRVAHISAVWNAADIAFLRQRHSRLQALPSFASMQWSEDPAELHAWMPLVMEGRDPRQPVAATRIQRGTDVDFGALTRCCLSTLQRSGALELQLGTTVSGLQRLQTGRNQPGDWDVLLKGPSGRRHVRAPFVFIGAGGGALTLLQRSGIPEARDYGGFPVSGQWLVCTDSSLAERHDAKVYGKAKVGAPPMSVPHLDLRWIDGHRSLLFGPFAGFSSKFLKQGSLFDLPRSVRPSNLMPMLQVGAGHVDLVRYLIGQVVQSPQQRIAALREFFPDARTKDWTLSIAGQRVQIIKRTAAGGLLQMGTEVVCSADGSLAGLLGASPGASTAVAIMLEVLQRCFPERLSSDRWMRTLQTLFPSYGQDPVADPQVLRAMRERSDGLLNLA